MTDSTQKITIKEFRMWLQGVEEMQDSAWTPNPTQWQRIREKIDTINDEVEPQRSGDRDMAVQMGNDQLGAVGYQTGFPAWPTNEQPTPIMPAMPVIPPSPPPHGLFGTPDLPQMPARTPNIDTANGTYQSSFA